METEVKSIDFTRITELLLLLERKENRNRKEYLKKYCLKDVCTCKKLVAKPEISELPNLF